MSRTIIVIKGPAAGARDGDHEEVATLTTADHGPHDNPGDVRVLAATGRYEDAVARGDIATLGDFLTLSAVNHGLVDWYYDMWDTIEEDAPLSDEERVLVKLAQAREHRNPAYFRREGRRREMEDSETLDPDDVIWPEEDSPEQKQAWLSIYDMNEKWITIVAAEPGKHHWDELLLDEERSDPQGRFEVYVGARTDTDLMVRIALDESGNPLSVPDQFNIGLVGSPTIWPDRINRFVWWSNDDLWWSE